MNRWLVILLAVVMNSGCSHFFSGDEASGPQVLEVTLDIDSQVNPDADNRAQPVKICIIETRRGGWLPQQLYEGRICEGLSASAEVIKFEEYILAPGQTKKYQAINPAYGNNSRWIIVGAEFQRGIGEYSLIERNIPAAKDVKIKVKAENTSLTFL